MFTRLDILIATHKMEMLSNYNNFES